MYLNLPRQALKEYFTYTGLLQSFHTPKMCHLWLINLYEKNALHIKFLLVLYPHFLKISFNLTKCGLSYRFKRDPRPFSEFTQVWIILSLTDSKMENSLIMHTTVGTLKVVFPYLIIL